MTKENARTLSQVFLVLSILSILFVCGNCCANSQKGTYGPEEVYSKGDGTYGYGAKYSNRSTDQGMLVAIIGGTLFLAFSIASGVFHSIADMDGAKPTELAKVGLSRRCSICKKKIFVMASVCPECGDSSK